MTPPVAGNPAALLDLPLLAPELTDEQVVAGIETARRYGIASVTVRPCDIDLAVRSLHGSSVIPAAVCAFPHGSQNTATKLFEARDLLRRGAKEIAAVIGISRLLSREFQHVQTELLQLAESCHRESARLTVILETGYLTDELKIIACACCERAEVDRVCPSAAGYTLADLQLLRKHLPEEVGIQAAGVQTLDQALELQALGCARISTGAVAPVLDEWASRQPATPAPRP
jgi:deoxyribose-phosphate aldolase